MKTSTYTFDKPTEPGVYYFREARFGTTRMEAHVYSHGNGLIVDFFHQGGKYDSTMLMEHVGNNGKWKPANKVRSVRSGAGNSLLDSRR